MEELLSIIDKGIKNFKDFKKKDLLKIKDLFLEELNKRGIHITVRIKQKDKNK